MKLEAIKENIEEILEHYPEDVRPLIKHQVITIIEFIGKEKVMYLQYREVKYILDLLLSEIIQGKYLKSE